MPVTGGYCHCFQNGDFRFLHNELMLVLRMIDVEVNTNSFMDT